ncbi:MAG TPA: hypothetical protein VIH86_06525 [Puia sp.]|jgi:hypothetical protein
MNKTFLPLRNKKKYRRPQWLSDFLILAVVILAIVIISIRKSLF